MPQKQVLREHTFTQGLTEAQIDHLAGISHPVSFKENEVVLVDGARSTSFFLLLTGSVVVELRGGQYVMALQALGPGDVFGFIGHLSARRLAQAPFPFFAGFEFRVEQAALMD